MEVKYKEIISKTAFLLWTAIVLFFYMKINILPKFLEALKKIG